MGGNGVAPTLVVTVGSDHHRFDRLIEWVDTWLETSVHEVDCRIQHGPAWAPRHGAGTAFVDHDELQQWMAEADIVVCQGGPMSILEARAAGRLPIVVPRRQDLGEVVDGHQLAFCRRLARDGVICLAETADELAAWLDKAVADPTAFRIDTGTGDHEDARTAAISELSRWADGLMSRGAHAHERPRVVYLGGIGRSGSTLLERMMGQAEGVTAAGEVVHLWERGALHNESCGCGAAFSDCAFWRSVGQLGFGGWEATDAVTVAQLREEIARNARIPLILAPWAATRFRARLHLYRRYLAPLYEAISRRANGDVIIDSSKHPAYAFALRRCVSLRVILVVRDSRGVAHSWGKRVERPEATSSDARFMQTYGAIGAAARWTAYNLLFHLLQLTGTPLLVIRYEDLVTEPLATLRRALAFAGAPVGNRDLAWVQDSAVHLGINHTVAGNPMRFRTGAVTLRQDEAWREQTPRAAQRLAHGTTLPLWWLYRITRSRHS